MARKAVITTTPAKRPIGRPRRDNEYKQVRVPRALHLLLTQEAGVMAVQKGERVTVYDLINHVVGKFFARKGEAVDNAAKLEKYFFSSSRGESYVCMDPQVCNRLQELADDFRDAYPDLRGQAKRGVTGGTILWAILAHEYRKSETVMDLLSGD